MVRFSILSSNSGKAGGEEKKVNQKLAGVFAKPEHKVEDRPRRNVITEFSKDTASSQNSSEEGDKLVIPCRNSLRDLKEDNESQNVPNQHIKELKYGLNVLFHSDHGEVEDGKVKEEEGGLDDSEDGKIAREIAEQLERKRLRDELFGTTQAQKKFKTTTPILLRSRVSDSRSRSNSVDLSQYSNSPISNSSTDEGRGGCRNGPLGGSKQLRMDQEAARRDENDIKKLLKVDMDQYDKVPVENFGLAMLLGMGYDPENNTNKPKFYTKRVYDRAGLGADSAMKSNMELMADGNLMSKLKKNYVLTKEGLVETNWAIPGIYVKIAQKTHPLYPKKGLVQSVNGDFVKLAVDGKVIQLNYKILETVVSVNSLCKVVRKVEDKKKKVEIGTLVRVLTLQGDHCRVQVQTKGVGVDEVLIPSDYISQTNNV